jgi:hypothetical protein
MENTSSSITALKIENENICITYDNGSTENIPIGRDSYVKMHDLWLVSQPPFISDLYKIQMRNIILATINNNEKCVSELNNFFSSGNETDVQKFFEYMRKRDLTAEKAKWSPATTQ